MTTYPAKGSSHFAIAIGINQYQSFQPLNYAQHDAQALQEFLVTEVGLPADHCLLLTDSSPEVQGRSTYPTRQTIQDWVMEWCQQQVKPGDTLWCFFCGYGVCFQGQDYLMPIDGNLADIAGTGIAMSSLFATLQATVGETAFLLLDMNRSSGIQSRGLTGTETINLARNSGVATLLSCQPGEFSHESPTLRQGFFTFVLLEGLRYYDCTNLSSLYQYLSQHLPQLKEHHHQPRQHPVAVGTADAILPPQLTDLTASGIGERLAAPFNRSQVTQIGNGTASVSTVSILEPTNALESPPADGGGTIAPGIYTSLLNQLVGNPTFSQPATQASQGSLSGRSPLEENGFHDRSSPAPTATLPDSNSWQPLRRLKDFGVGSPDPQPSDNGATLPPNPEEIEVEDPVFWRRILLGGGAIAVLLLLGTLLRNGAVFWGQPAGNSNPVPASPSVNSTSPQLPQPPSTLVTKQTQPVPVTAVPLNSSFPPQPSLPPLSQARKVLTANQASRFSDAIKEARQIRPGQPLYPQARQDIERWSRVILDLAEGRAVQGQYANAIATAALVPADSATYLQAQQTIAQWKSQITSRQVPQSGNADLLAQAVSQIKLDSASSYSDAIRLAKEIKVGDRQYNQAQQLIDEWSQMILIIAQKRATQGNLQRATEAARLVPQKTSAYPQAQQAIQAWSQPRR